MGEVDLRIWENMAERGKRIREMQAEIDMLARALAEYESDSRIAARYASLRLSVRA